MSGYVLGEIYSHIINESSIAEKIEKKGSFAISEIRKLERDLIKIHAELYSKSMKNQVKLSNDKEIVEKLDSIIKLSVEIEDICKTLKESVHE